MKMAANGYRLRKAFAGCCCSLSLSLFFWGGGLLAEWKNLPLAAIFIHVSYKNGDLEYFRVLSIFS